MTTSTITRTDTTTTEDTDDLWHRSCGRCQRAAALRGLPVMFYCGKVVPAITRRKTDGNRTDVCVVCLEIDDAGGCTIHPRRPH